MIITLSTEKGNQFCQALQIVILLRADIASAVVDADNMKNICIGMISQEGGCNLQSFQVLRLGDYVDGTVCL